MSTVISKTPNAHGTFRIIRNVDLSVYPAAQWEHSPDVTGVENVPETYWKYDGTNVVVEMLPAEKALIADTSANIKNQATAGVFIFEKRSIVRNKWLGFGSAKSSNNTPFIVSSMMTVSAITFINDINGIDTDIELYKNGIKMLTWSLRDKRWAWRTKDLYTLTFRPGDQLSVFLRDKGANPKNVIVTIHYASWNHEVGEGGAAVL